MKAAPATIKGTGAAHPLLAGRRGDAGCERDPIIDGGCFAGRKG